MVFSTASGKGLTKPGAARSTYAPKFENRCTLSAASVAVTEITSGRLARSWYAPLFPDAVTTTTPARSAASTAASKSGLAVVSNEQLMTSAPMRVA